EELRQVEPEMQPLAVAGHELRQPGLVQVHLAAVEGPDQRVVDVDAPDLMAQVREARGRDETDPPDADDAERLARPLAHRPGTGRKLRAMATIVLLDRSSVREFVIHTTDPPLITAMRCR